MENKKNNNRLKEGILYGIGAYGLWGILPVYWKQIHHVPALEILANRFIWSAVFVFLILYFTGRLERFRKETKETFSNWQSGVRMVAASVMVFFNWGIYIWAVEDGRILETALGYYINPLLSVVLAVVFLKEWLNRLEWLSVFLAFCGISSMVVKTGYLPWVSLVVPSTFAIYGLLKKCIPVSPFTSTMLETLIMLPFMLGYLIYLWLQGNNAFQLYDGITILYLVGCGIVTAIPLLFFAACTQCLPLNMVGFMQYLSPTLSMLIGVLLYDEAFTVAHMWTFGMIWLGLGFFSYSQYRKML
ncbi:MAG: EamA family transporter RarD [Phascolarctobacterium sp.]|nr:EamA family transporter RarD [Phascolarctobacterium sp.]